MSVSLLTPVSLFHTGQNPVWYRYRIWNCCHAHFCIIFLKMQEEIFVVDVCEQITIHHQYRVIIELIHETYTTNCTQILRFPYRLHLHLSSRFCEMFLQLLSEIIDRHGYIFYTITNQAVYIVVNDSFIPYLQQWLGRFIRYFLQSTKPNYLINLK